VSKNSNPKLEAAALKLGRFLAKPTAAAASATVSMLITLFTSILVPVLADLLTAVLAKPGAQQKYGKFLIPARDVLNGANLGDK